MNPEEESRLRARLSEVSSLRQIYKLIEDIAALETTARNPALLLVIRSILQELAWALEGLPPTSSFAENMIRIQQNLAPAMSRAFDEAHAGDAAGVFRELNRLASQWALLRPELR